MNGLKKFIEKIFTFYLFGTEYHTETYDGPFAMIQSVEDLELLLEHLSEEEVHDTPIEELPYVAIDNVECVEIPLSYLRKERLTDLLKNMRSLSIHSRILKMSTSMTIPLKSFAKNPYLETLLKTILISLSHKIMKIWQS